VLRGTEAPISECFPYERLSVVQYDPWNADIVNYFIDMILEGWNKHDRDKILHLVKFYIWNGPYLFKYYSNQIVRKCVPDYEV